MAERKLAVLFSGIGYKTDRSLLYYSGKFARENGFELARVDFEGLPQGMVGNPEKTAQGFMIAFEQTEKFFRNVDFRSYDKILFISKSFGTAVSVAYAMQYRIPAKFILYTPMIQTFMPFDRDMIDGIVFHGTKDQTVDFAGVFESCRDKNIPLYGIEDANHSLETQDAMRDIQNLQSIMKVTEEFIKAV